MIDIIITHIQWLHQQIGPLLWLGIMPGMFGIFRIHAYWFKTTSPLKGTITAILNMIVFLCVSIPLFLGVIGGPTNILDNPYHNAIEFLSDIVATIAFEANSQSYYYQEWITRVIWLIIGASVANNILLKMRGLYILDHPNHQYEYDTPPDFQINQARAKGIPIYYHFPYNCIKVKYADQILTH